MDGTIPGIVYFLQIVHSWHWVDCWMLPGIVYFLQLVHCWLKGEEGVVPVLWQHLQDGPLLVVAEVPTQEEG